MAPTKTCPGCSKRLPLDAFAVDKSKASGRKSRCKACDRAKARGYYQANAEKKAAYHAEHRAPRLAEMKANRDAIRSAAVRIYGSVCEWCGSDADLEFDHADDDGAEHRLTEEVRAMLRRIVATGARIEDRRLRLLCRPCHRGPGWEERRAAHA